MSLAIHCPDCGGSGRRTGTREVPAGPHNWTTQTYDIGPCSRCGAAGFVFADRSDVSIAGRCFMCDRRVFRAPSSWGGAYRCSHDNRYIRPSEVGIFGNCKLHGVPAAQLPSIKMYHCLDRGTAWLCEACLPSSGKCPGRCGRRHCGARLERDTGAWFDCD